MYKVISLESENINLVKVPPAYYWITAENSRKPDEMTNLHKMKVHLFAIHSQTR